MLQLILGLFCKNFLILWKCVFYLLHSKCSYFIFQRKRKSGLKNSLYNYASTNNSFSLEIKLKIKYFRRIPLFLAFYSLVIWGWLAGKGAGAVLKCSLFFLHDLHNSCCCLKKGFQTFYSMYCMTHFLIIQNRCRMVSSFPWWFYSLTSFLSGFLFLFLFPFCWGGGGGRCWGESSFGYRNTVSCQCCSVLYIEGGKINK